MTQPVLLTVASAAEHPLLDIDLTAVVQFGIFCMAYLAARKFLFRPYLAMRDERSAGIEGARKEAAEMSAKADAQLHDYEEKLATARAKANEERRKVRAEAAEHQRVVTEKANATAVEAMEKAQRDVANKVESARSELLPQASVLGADMVKQLLEREVA